MDHLVESLFMVVYLIINKLSYLGIVGLMAIESANIPVPSEAIMPFAGALVSKGLMNIHLAAFAGALGCLIGSLVSYYLGYFGGRTFLEKYGKYILFSHHDLVIGDKLFVKYGDSIAFLSRLVPVVRTFISFPAGISKMNVYKFAIYSFLGSWIWSYLLVFIGLKIGDNQHILAPYFHKFDLVIGIILLICFVLYVYRHIRKLKS